ncbi:DNA replication licensing factor Mcm7, partial [Caerostris darwini]
MPVRNYAGGRTKIGDFLSGFVSHDSTGKKYLKYGLQLTKLAHRDEVISCSRNAETQEVGPKDILDVYVQHRLKMDAMNHTEGEYRDNKNQYPPELLRRFEIYFKNRSEEDQLSVREVKAEHIGKLIT